MKKLLLILALFVPALAFATQGSPLQCGMLSPAVAGSPAEGTGIILGTAQCIPPVNMTGNTATVNFDVGDVGGNFQLMIYDSDGTGGIPKSPALHFRINGDSIQRTCCRKPSPSSGGSCPTTLARWPYPHPPFFQLEQCNRRRHQRLLRRQPGILRYFQSGTTYGSPPATLTSTGSQPSFGWYSVNLNLTAATPTVQAGWPGPIDQAFWFGKRS